MPALAGVVLLGGCAHGTALVGQGPVPDKPGEQIQALPAAPPPPKEATFTLPENWRQLAEQLTLADIVNIALANNEQTRSAWFSARSAAAQLGSKRSAYYPSLNLDLDVTRTKLSAVGGLFNLLQTTYGPSISLNYLLFDFGGRRASVDEARDSLLAADYTHNKTIQDVVLQVQQAYYTYLDAKANLAGAVASVKEAQVNLEAARKKHEVGVATIADVLQAQTAFSQAQLTRQTYQGQIQTLRGALATAMGIPANTPFEVGALPENVPVSAVSTQVEPLIKRALDSRPDLQAARWDAEKAARHIKKIKAEGLPSFSLSASANRTYYSPVGNSAFTTGWAAGVTLSVPLFTGFKNHYDIRQAEADAQVSLSTARTLEQQVTLDVWTAYANLETAGQSVATAKDLLDSATESEKVALGRYKEGVGSIIDLLTAQAALASARAQEIQARTNWLVSVASLANATGSIGPIPDLHVGAQSAPPAPPAPASEEDHAHSTHD